MRMPLICLTVPEWSLASRSINPRHTRKGPSGSAYVRSKRQERPNPRPTTSACRWSAGRPTRGASRGASAIRKASQVARHTQPKAAGSGYSGAERLQPPMPAPRLRPPEKAPGDLREGLRAEPAPHKRKIADGRAKFMACFLIATPHNAILCNRAKKPASYITGIIGHVFYVMSFAMLIQRLMTLLPDSKRPAKKIRSLFTGHFFY
jgi:hypothetical protein